MKKSRPLWLKWILCALPAVLATTLYLLLPHLPGFTEWVFARGVFRVVAFPAEWVLSIFPVSLTELVVVLAAPALIALLVVWILRVVRSPHRGRTVERGCRFVAWCLSLALLVFMVMDGVNFSRLPLGQLMGLPQNTYTAEQLYTLTVDLAQKASAVREELPQDEDGCTVLTASLSDTLLAADDSYRNLRQQYPYLVSGTWRIKPVALSHLWSYTGYTGVYCPWLGEASVNVDVPPCELGHTAAHELAHTMGFAKENECNFLAWLACATSELPDYAYSGHLTAFIYCSNALHTADRSLWKQAYSFCSDGMLRDLQQRNTYWRSFEGEVMDSSQVFNDAFIKVNGVESGVISYDEMVELMLRYYDQQGWL